MIRTHGVLRTIIPLCCLALLSVLPAAGQEREPAYSAHLGVDLFAWEAPFLVTGGDVRFPIRTALYGSLGADFGIRTETEGSETTASFLLPMRAGLLFPFSGETLSFSFTAGLSPVFLFADETGFYLGPYAGARIRAEVHPVLSVFAELQQTLLFGGDDWINTGTRLTGGISF